ncbi:hypothetical protein AMTR_s00155p00085010 [Amborella trichopoda]|uniref:Uncharacterized protein n=1 Tax=Amborella trichopoda TaxID=13333 RepID=W1PCS3_AMBTC|nr:hypothetical protein AMTR_s00155p00085010 [Amborella trichopoda]
MNVSWNPHLELFNFNEADMNVSRNPHLELFNSNEATVFSRYNSSPQNFVKVDDFFNFNEASSDSTNSKYNSDELFNFNEASRDSTKTIIGIFPAQICSDIFLNDNLLIKTYLDTEIYNSEIDKVSPLLRYRSFPTYAKSFQCPR